MGEEMFFYRYEDYQSYNGVKVQEYRFKLVKETPCGYWIEDHNFLFNNYSSAKKWVSKTSRKRFAYPTKEEAMYSFKMRKTRQIEILTARIKNAKEALHLVENNF